MSEAPPPFLYRAPSKVHMMDAEFQRKVGPDDVPWTSPPQPAAGQVVKTFLSERLSAHAIPRIFKSPSVVRQVAWTVVSLVFLGLLIWQVVITVQSYITFPKTTSVEVVDATRIHFPAVTVCNLNPLVRSRARNTRWKSAADLDLSIYDQEEADSAGTEDRRRRKRETGSSTESPVETTTYYYDSTTGGNSESPVETTAYYYDEYSDSTTGGSSDTSSSPGSLSTNIATSPPPTSPSPSSPSPPSTILASTAATVSTTSATASTVDAISSPSSASTDTASTMNGTIEELRTSTDPVSTAEEGSGTVDLSTETTADTSTTVITTSDATMSTDVATITDAATTDVVTITDATTTEEAMSTDAATTTDDAATTDATTTDAATTSRVTSTTTTTTTEETYPDGFPEDDPTYKSDLDDSLQEQFYGSSLENFTTVLQAMKTIDGSEISDVFTPSKQEIIEAGVRPEEFIASCSFNGDACNVTDFLQWQNGVYGNCFTFNSVFTKMTPTSHISGKEELDAVKSTTHYGARYGLRLMLSPDLDEYIPSVTPGQGVRLSIHHPQEVPFPEDNGMNVRISSRTSISVKREEVKRVSEPYGKCTTDDEWNEQYVGSYSAEGCVNVCLESRIRARCHCIRMLNTIISDDDVITERCNPTNRTQDVCVAEVRVNFLHDIEPCVCLSPCHEKMYTAGTSFNGDNANFSDILSEVKKIPMPMDPVKIHVYMETLSAKVVKEEPAFTAFTLISNIGGSFGLFVGLSLVTVVELLEFLYDFCVMMVPRGYSARAGKAAAVAPAA